MNHQDFLAQSIEELRLKTAAHDRLWHLGEADWSVDQDAGEIVFSAPNGMVATCPVQIIGTFNTGDSTWLWAWDHPSVQPALAEHAIRLRDYGQANGITDLATRKLSATEERCWEFTALACKLNEAQGGYRGPAGSTLVFMTFGEPKLSGTVADDESDPPISIEPDAGYEFTPDIPADVQSTLIGFITALRDWNVAAYRAYEADDSRETMETAKRNYTALLREWCVPELQPQSVSFGDDPGHDPETERFISAAEADGQCRVRTQYTNTTGFVSDYEYHLRCESGKWLVENLFYVADGDKYEML
jgi:hypothetical protein